MCKSPLSLGRELQLKQSVPVAMTDLCKTCVEAEPPKARESLQTWGGQPGIDAVLAR